MRSSSGTGSILKTGDAHPDAPARPPFEPFAIRPLLHPTERSRLALAVVAAVVTCVLIVLILVLAGQTPALAVLLAVLVLLLGSIWLGLQVHRATLLGQSVRVTRRSLPDVQDALDQVREQLDYHRPIDVYIAAKLPAPAIVVSYLGTKMILMEGGLIGDLLEPARRPQLTFLLARYVGAFKARHMRMELVALLISSIQGLRFMNAFLLPYYRATAYSGDQIGLACCGDLRTALAATQRLMTGKDVAPAVAAKGVIDQAAVVSHRLLPRFAQLFSAAPHLTNRYLNLLFFARANDPVAWNDFLGELDDETRNRVAALGARSHHGERGPAVPLPDEAPRATTSPDPLYQSEDWGGDAGTRGSAAVAILAAGLFAVSVLTAEGGLGEMDTLSLVVDALLVTALLAAGSVTNARRTPGWAVVTALVSAALAGWTGLLPAVDVAVADFVDMSLGVWMLQAAGIAALAAAVGLSVSWGQLAMTMERDPRWSTRLWDIGAVVAGALVAGSSFLPRYDLGDGTYSLWELQTGIYDALSVALSAALVCVALAAVLSRGRGLPWVTALLGCMTFTFVFSPSDLGEDYSLEIGWWLAQIGGGAALTCAVLGWLTAEPPSKSPGMAAEGEAQGQLEELARLHREGILSSEEVAAARARIIGGAAG